MLFFAGVHCVLMYNDRYQELWWPLVYFPACPAKNGTGYNKGHYFCYSKNNLSVGVLFGYINVIETLLWCT